MLDSYEPDHRLRSAYTNATCLTPDGMDALCPSYLQLTEIEQRYCKETLIGEGGVKQVFRAFDNYTKRWVALARLRTDRGADFYDFFVHEAWLTSSLQHPNIINVYDVGIDENERPFFTMDLRRKGNLADLMSRKEPVKLKDLLSIFLKICDAISYSHSRNIIHLDLKPENIQTAAYGEVLICDWGLGKIIGEEDLLCEDFEVIPELRDNVTLFREIKGTPGYMAPEQIRANERKGRRTDIFSLGCILHTMLVGEPPFTGSREEVLAKTLNGEIALFEKEEFAQQVPESLKAVVRKALAGKLEDRYSNAIEMKEDVRRFLHGYTTQAENSNFCRETLFFIARNRLPVLVSCLGLVLFSVLGTLGIQKINSANRTAVAERAKHERLRHEVSQTTAQYDDELSRIEREKKEVVRVYSEAGQTLQAIAFFHQPRKTVDGAYEIARESLAFDPHSRRALVELFYLNLITLNFKGVHEQPPPSDTLRYYFIKLPDTFPDFDYGSVKRPEVEALSDLFETAKETLPGRFGFLERILCYDSASRRDKRRYHLVVASYLRYLNVHEEEIVLEPVQAGASYRLQAEGPLKLISGKGGSLHCVLNYLPMRNLVLEVNQEFRFFELDWLEVTTLDLTGCPNLVLTRPVHLPNITTIKVREGRVDAEALKSLVRTVGDFDVITVPEGD